MGSHMQLFPHLYKLGSGSQVGWGSMPLEMRGLYPCQPTLLVRTQVQSKWSAVQGDPWLKAWLQSLSDWQCRQNSLDLGGSGSITKVSTGALFGMNLDSLSTPSPPHMPQAMTMFDDVWIWPLPMQLPWLDAFLGSPPAPSLGSCPRELMGMAGLTRHWKDPVLPPFLCPSSPPTPVPVDRIPVCCTPDPRALPESEGKMGLHTEPRAELGR